MFFGLVDTTPKCLGRPYELLDTCVVLRPCGCANGSILVYKNLIATPGIILKVVFIVFVTILPLILVDTKLDYR